MELNQFFKEAAELGGWLAGDEVMLFHRLAFDYRYISGNIVEIGSYVGKSTAGFAKGLQDSDKETKNKSYIFAIDPFQGSPEHSEFIKNNTNGFTQGTTFPSFLDNLKRLEVYDNVVPLATYSDTVAQWWNLPIKILFIDGYHGELQPVRDYTNFRKYLVDNALVIYHDNDHEEVQQSMRECEKDGFIKIYEQGVLTIYRKRSI